VIVTLTLLPVQLTAMAVGHSLMQPAAAVVAPDYLPHHRSQGCISMAGISARRPLLIVSNHVSWKDILVLGSVADVVFVAKSEVRHLASVRAGWPVCSARSLSIAPSRVRPATQTSQVSERLLAGEAVVLFAEGTTSDGNRVLPFKSSLFGAASAALPLCA
jgi:1-acyl-sn-glycerol-3-phosphate acyltransferase